MPTPRPPSGAFRPSHRDIIRRRRLFYLVWPKVAAMFAVIFCILHFGYGVRIHKVLERWAGGNVVLENIFVWSFFAVYLGGFYLWFRAMKRRESLFVLHRKAGFELCTACRYPLNFTESSTGRCPECGRLYAKWHQARLLRMGGLRPPQHTWPPGSSDSA